MNYQFISNHTGVLEYTGIGRQIVREACGVFVYVDEFDPLPTDRYQQALAFAESLT